MTLEEFKSLKIGDVLKTDTFKLIFIVIKIEHESSYRNNKWSKVRVVKARSYRWSDYNNIDKCWSSELEIREPDQYRIQSLNKIDMIDLTTRERDIFYSY